VPKLSDGFIIRDGRLEDRQEIYNLWKEAVDYNNSISDIDLEADDEAAELYMKYFETYVKSESKKALVAEDNGRIVGYILGGIPKKSPIRWVSHCAYMGGISVAPHRRQKGIGSKLLNEFSLWAKEKGMNSMMVNVVSENLTFFEKQGFKTLELCLRKSI
jgi:ribosomal protein S18 acetylase RimI-like enzyme